MPSSRENVQVLARVVESRGAHAFVGEKVHHERVAELLQHAGELALVGRARGDHDGLFEAGVDVEQAQEDAQQHGVVRGRGCGLELARLLGFCAPEHHRLDAGERLPHEAAHELVVFACKSELDEVRGVAAPRHGREHELRVRHGARCRLCSGSVSVCGVWLVAASDAGSDAVRGWAGHWH